jgi:hypothetical protein
MRIIREKDLSEFDWLLEYKPYVNFLEWLNKDEFFTLINNIVEKIRSSGSIKYASLLYSIYNHQRYMFSIDRQRELCNRLRELWFTALSRLRSINDFVEYIESYSELIESRLYSFLTYECRFEDIMEPYISLSNLKEMLKNSIRHGRSYDELRYAVDKLRGIDRELSKRIRRTLKYYRRKYSLK